ncbi:MAG: 50S ribosomal protein L24 [Thermoplasmata archaeon]|jgi:large subunit ribosomal protein L24|nr:50S ribosomal protein L24 [Thermoplasmata archaeon]
MVTSNTGKTRKRQYNAPAHTKRKMLSSHLSDELSQKYGRKAVRVCAGDTVVVKRGQESIRGIEGKVIEVFTKTGRVTIDGITVKQADGTQVAFPVHASNLVITKLNLEDPLREEIIMNKEATE